jgi:hypothetical protein
VQSIQLLTATHSATQHYLSPHHGDNNGGKEKNFHNSTQSTGDTGAIEKKHLKSKPSLKKLTKGKEQEKQAVCSATAMEIYYTILYYT